MDRMMSAHTGWVICFTQFTSSNSKPRPPHTENIFCQLPGYPLAQSSWPWPQNFTIGPTLPPKLLPIYFFEHGLLSHYEASDTRDMWQSHTDKTNKSLVDSFIKAFYLCQKLLAWDSWEPQPWVVSWRLSNPRKFIKAVNLANWVQILAVPFHKNVALGNFCFPMPPFPHGNNDNTNLIHLLWGFTGTLHMKHWKLCLARW